NAPRLQGPDSAIDEVYVSLYVPSGCPEEDIRHGSRLGLGILENLLIQAQLVNGIDQIVLLVANVDTVEHREEIAFFHHVARTNLAIGCLAGAERVGHIIRSRGDLNDLGGRRRRSESGPDPQKTRGIKGSRSGHYERRASFGLFRDGQDILIALTNTKCLSDI